MVSDLTCNVCCLFACLFVFVLFHFGLLFFICVLFGFLSFLLGIK